MTQRRAISVCTLTTSFPRFEGDMAGRPVYELCRELSGKVRMSVLAPHAPGLPKTEDMAGCSIYRFQYFWPAGLQKLAYGGAGIPANLRSGWLPKVQVLPFLSSFLVQALRRCRGCDLIHAQFAPSALVAVAVNALTRKPFILTLRGTGARWLAGPVLRTVLSRAASVISPHPELTRLARSCGRADVQEIPNPIDLARFSPPVQGSAACAAGPNSHPTIAFVGRLVDFKDPETFVRCVPFVRKRVPAARFCVVGDGPLLPELKALAESLGCSGSVDFPGYQPHVLPFLQRSSVFVACSRAENVWSNSLVEAMSCAIPCVATDAGFTKEKLGPHDAAVLVRAADPEGLGSAISELLLDEGRRRRIGENARALVERVGFSRADVGARTLEVYERLLRSA